MSGSPEDFQMIVGKSPWRVWKGFGSFLLFEFGRAHRNEDGSQRGAYTLWIYMAKWRIRRSRRELAHSESPDKSIHRATEALTHKKLEAIVLSTVILKHRRRYGAVFHFEDGYSLHATMYDRSKDEAIFMLYSPRACLSYKTDGTICSTTIKKR